MSGKKRLIMVIYFAIVLSIGAWASAVSSVKERISDSTSDFKDVVVHARVTYANAKALSEISKDMPRSYNVKSSTLSFKYPDKMRMEGRVSVIKAVMIINGDMKAIVIPGIHVISKRSIKGQPHMRQTELDLGILTRSLWNDYIVRSAEAEDSANGSVYKIVFVRSNALRRNLVVWADEKSLKMLKLEKHDEDGSMKVRYVFSDHHRVNGIWVPGRIDVYNRQGKLGATSMYEDIRVNSGLPDSLFKIN